MGLGSFSIESTLNSTPELGNSPGLAMDVANSDAPDQLAPVISQAANAQALNQAVQDDSLADPGEDGGGFFGKLINKTTHWAAQIGEVPVLGTGLHYLAKPLHELQRDYRILHIAWSRDPGTGLLATLGVVGGAALGTVIAPGIGTQIGAFAGGELVGRGLTQVNDELRKDAELADDPETKISLGRDIANGFGQIPGLDSLRNTDAGAGKIISGVTDLVADFALDPIVMAAKLKVGLSAGELGTLAKNTTGANAERWTRGLAEDGKAVSYLRATLNGDFLRKAQIKSVGDWFDKVAPGTKVRAGAGGAQVEALWNAPAAGASYRRATEDIARIARDEPKVATGKILDRYPMLGGMLGTTELSDGTVLHGLDKIKTAEEVHARFVQVAEDGNFAARMQNGGVLPTRTLTRKTAGAVSEFIRQIDGGEATAAGAARAGQTTLKGAAKQTAVAPFKAVADLVRPAEFDASAAEKFQGFQGRLRSAQNTLGGDVRDAWAGAIARKVRTFTGYMPFAMDKETLAISRSSFQWRSGQMDPLALKAVHSSFRFGMGTNRARYWTDQFANARTLGEAKRIYAEAQVENLKAFGLPDHSVQMQAIQKQIADYVGGPIHSPKNQFGFGANQGVDVDVIDGVKSALWLHQTDNTFHFPDYLAMRYEMGKLQGGMRSAYTSWDDFVANKFVNSVFKPLALMNAGFGMRVAVAEAIPQAMRVGVMTTMRDYVNATASRKGYKLVENEVDDVLPAVIHALSQSPVDPAGIAAITGKDIAKSAGKAAMVPVDTVTGGMWRGMNAMLNDPFRRELAMKLVLSGNGHIAIGGAATGEGGGGYHYDEEPSAKYKVAAHDLKSKYKNDPRIKWQNSENFGSWSQDADQFDGYLHAALSKVSRERPAQLIAADLGKPAGDLNLFRVQAGELPKEIPPHGVYHSLVDDPAVFTSPHTQAATWDSEASGLPVTQTRGKADSRNALEVTDQAPVTHARFKGVGGGSGSPSAGVAALRQLAPDDFARLSSMSKEDLVTELETKFPGPDYARYHDSYELLEAYGAQLARSQGHDGIIYRDAASPNFSEYVALQPQRVNEDAAIAAETDRINAVIHGRADADPYYVKESRDLRIYDLIKAQKTTAEEVAASRVDAVRGLTEGKNGSVMTDARESIARGEAPDMEYLQGLPMEMRPAQVYGPIPFPHIGDNLLQRVINKGFKKLVDPVIMHLSRDPMYFNHVFDEYTRMEYLVKEGKLSEDDVLQIAKTRGAVAMLPKIHNTALRSQFSQMARNFFPFYFAQEQALKRAGKLIAENPGAFRQYQLMEHAMSDPGFVQVDDQGNRYLLFPVGGALGDAFFHMANFMPGMNMEMGLPISIKGSMTSLNTLLPESQMPGVSPIVSVPLNKLAHFFPELSPAVKNIVGEAGFDQPMLDALLPHPVIKNVWRAMDANERDKQFGNAYLTALATAVGSGHAPAPDAPSSEWDEFYDKIKQNVRSTYILKAGLGLFSPVAPQVKIDDGLRQEFLDLVKAKKAELGEAAGYKEALHDWLTKHGSNGSIYTIGKTRPTIDGARFKYTNEALQWLTAPDVQAAMGTSFQTGLAYLTPQVGDEQKADIQVIHSEMLRMHLRENLTNKEFINKFLVAQGYADISEARKKYDADLLQYKNDKSATTQVKAAWSAYIRDQGVKNLTWYDDYQSPARTQNALAAYENMTALLRAPGAQLENGQRVPVIATRTEMWGKVASLLDDYERHRRALAKHKGTPKATTERASWSSWLDQVEASDPSLSSVVDGVFRRLDSTGLTLNG